MQGIFGLDIRDGRVVRSLVPMKTVLRERFSLVFDPDLPDDEYLHYHGRNAVFLDAQPFVESPTLGIAIAYERELNGEVLGDTLDLQFSSQVADDRARGIEIDLAGIAPLDEASFWKFLAPLRTELSEDTVADVVRLLGKERPETILGFAVRKQSILRTLNTPELAVLSQAGSGDAFLWWRLAVVGAGPRAYELAQLGQNIVQDAWASGEFLLNISERAYEVSTDTWPQFVDGVQGELEAHRSRPAYLGSRDIAAMVGAGYFPQVVGSRFLRSHGSVVFDTVVMQLADPRREPSDVFADIARETCERRGGTLASEVVVYMTDTANLFDGLGIFMSRRPRPVGVADVLTGTSRN